MDAWGTKLN
jgi:isopenicillin N synthase-like dioxygenase